MRAQKTLHIIDLGKTKYADAWDLQQRCFTARKENAIPDLLLFTEHHHVYTMGKAADENHLLATERELADKHIDIFWIDRGGDVTYHGPGQIVGYPIIDMHGHYLDIHRYLRDLEEVIIRTLSDFGIVAGREPDFTGVWVQNEKIAALGVKVSRWITMHGFALNVNTALHYFDRIIPCGIFHKGVTSLQEISGKEQSMHEVRSSLMKHFAEIFSYTIHHSTTEELTTLLSTCEPILEVK